MRGLGDFVGLREAALADPSAGEIAAARIDELHAARGERREVRLHRRVLEHVGVHRRREQDRLAQRQDERRQEVVGDPVRELGDDVGGRGRDQEQIDFRGERDVLDVRVHAGRELIADHPASRNRLERDGPDEAARRSRHQRDHVVAALLEAARDLHGLSRLQCLR